MCAQDKIFYNISNAPFNVLKLRFLDFMIVIHIITYIFNNIYMQRRLRDINNKNYYKITCILTKKIEQ